MNPELRPSHLAEDFKASVIFLTRLPFPHTAPVTGFDIARAAWAFPLAGIVVGLIGGLVYALAYRVGLPAWPAAALAVAATIAATGCLHEDGLADTADGFGGGKTLDSKLDIMRDSRIGTYGVCALTMSILLRVSAVANLSEPHLVVLALIAAHGAARATIPLFMFLLPPARSDGLSFGVGTPPQACVTIAGVLGVLILAATLGPIAGIAALISLLVATSLVGWLSFIQIKGQTGDVVGALEQVCEIVILLVALH